MLGALGRIGRQGRHCLIAGLAAGLALPGMAEALRPWVGTMIAVMLVVTGLRVGLRAALGSLADLWPALTRIALLQVVLPLAALALFASLGLMGAPLALAVVLMLSAPSVTGAPNFAIMIGADPAPGMRLLVLGTALFPLTALPLLLLLDPTGGGVPGALRLAGGLMAAIVASVGLGFALRRAVPRLAGPDLRPALDGAAALLLALIVVGLMSAIGPLLRTAPATLALWLAVVLAINFGLVLGVLWLTERLRAGLTVATALYAGNRNIALFLIVLPAEVAAPLMIFVGCYQVPMYLTPLLLSRLRATPAPEAH